MFQQSPIYQEQPFAEQYYFTHGIKICPSCGYINSANPIYINSCGKCGVDISKVAVLTGAALVEILVNGFWQCFLCRAQYYGRSVCISCPNSRLHLIANPKSPSLPNQDQLSVCPKCTNKKLPSPFCDRCGRMHQLELSYYHSDDVRPTIPIQLRNGDRRIKTTVLIDYGAQASLLHGYLAKIVGIDFTNAPSCGFTGLGSGIVTGYEVPIEIGFLGKFYPTRIYFSDDLPANILGMLGHQGFLDRFHAPPDNRNRRILLSEHDLLHEKQCKWCPLCGKEREDEYSNYCGKCGTSLIIPLDKNGYLPSQQPATTTGQPLVFVGNPNTYQVASTMQVQSVTSAIAPRVLGEDGGTRQLITSEQEDRLCGLYVIGKTGSSKTILIVNVDKMKQLGMAALRLVTSPVTLCSRLIHSLSKKLRQGNGYSDKG